MAHRYVGLSMHTVVQISNRRLYCRGNDGGTIELPLGSCRRVT
jgi:hypothetical protein